MDLTDKKDPEHSWIEYLVGQELKREETGIFNLEGHLLPETIFNEAGLQVLEKMRYFFQKYITTFNTMRSKTTTPQHIKMFKISGTEADFMLFRHDLKMIITHKNLDCISIGFLSQEGKPFSARLNVNTSSINRFHDILGNIEAFNNVNWTFEGKSFDLESLCKHYFKEFIALTLR